jgi:hypothetical protein
LLRWIERGKTENVMLIEIFLGNRHARGRLCTETCR